MEAILKKEVIVNKVLCRTIGVLTFIILTSLGAFVRIPLPFTPVPITLQTFFVLLSGAFLGSGLGLLSQAGYMLLGAFGMPVFTNAAYGPLYLLGPTGGYIFGFSLAALFIGSFIKYAKGNLLCIFGIFCLADALLLSCGVLWLKIILGFSFHKIFIIGFLPFVVPDLLKAFIAAGIYLKFKTRLKEIF